MSSEQDSQREAKALLSELNAIYSEWDKSKPPTKHGYADASKILNLTRALVFCTDPEGRKEIEAQLYLNPEAIAISVSPIEFLLMQQGLNLLIQSFEAEQYIKESIGVGVTSEQRWSNVAEIMLLKEPGEKLSSHGSTEFCLYWGLIQGGMNPGKASEEVFKRFKFNSQEACDQWLKREITKRRKENPRSIYDEIPKPSTGPRIE